MVFISPPFFHAKIGKKLFRKTSTIPINSCKPFKKVPAAESLQQHPYFVKSPLLVSIQLQPWNNINEVALMPQCLNIFFQ